MLDNPDKYGIYPTTKCYNQLEEYIKLREKKHKEKIQNVQRRLKKETKAIDSLSNKILPEIIDKIFLEEIGGKLLNV